MTTAPGAAATVGLPVTQIPAGNAMKSDNMRDPGTIGAEDADAGPALAEGLDPSTVLMAMSRDMQHEGTVDDDPLQCQPQPSEGTGGGKEADHDGHPLLVFDKVLVRSDVEQGLYVPTEKAKVVKQMAEGSSPFDPILIEVRGQLTSPIFVKGTKWGPDGSALKLTGNWDEVVSGLGLTAGILVEVCILSTYLAAERGVQAPGCAPRVIVTSITVVHGAQRPLKRGRPGRERSANGRVGEGSGQEREQSQPPQSPRHKSNDAREGAATARRGEPHGDGTLAAQVEGLFNVVERLDATMHEMRSRVDQLWGTVYMMMPSWMPGVMGGAAMAQMQGMGHMGTLAAHAYHLGARGAAFPPAMSMGMMAETMGAPSAMGRPQQEGHQRPRPDGSLPQPWGPYSMRATYPRYEYE